MTAQPHLLPPQWRPILSLVSTIRKLYYAWRQDLSPGHVGINHDPTLRPFGISLCSKTMFPVLYCNRLSETPVFSPSATLSTAICRPHRLDSGFSFFAFSFKHTPGLQVTGAVGVRWMIQVKQDYHSHHAGNATFPKAVSDAMAIPRNCWTLWFTLTKTPNFFL